MRELRFTLLTDGASDAALIHPLTWLLRNNGLKFPISPQWADLSRLRPRPVKLFERMAAAVEWYPCELLFVHRDAERQPREVRVAEIRQATQVLSNPPAVCVVPVRMTEAWFLFNENAIRRAAGNPHGKNPLGVPKLRDHENEPDPKQVLRSALLAATELPSRRKRGFPVTERIGRVAELIDDYSPLRALSAFGSLEEELRKVLADNGWN
jgi:hypothetical protein